MDFYHFELEFSSYTNEHSLDITNKTYNRICNSNNGKAEIKDHNMYFKAQQLTYILPF